MRGVHYCWHRNWDGTEMTELVLPEFQPWPKLSRFNRPVIITEKIDGTNAIIHIDAVGHITAGSRTRWITPTNDNFGFAAWVDANALELQKLGEGYHYGEWYGSGIQRGYGLNEKRLALFNTSRWGAHNPNTPACCSVVPVLRIHENARMAIDDALNSLRLYGSVAVPGFMDPEGIVVYHTASKQMQKVTLKDDHKHKGELQ